MTVSVEYEDITWARLQVLAADTGRTIPQVLKEALELEVWFVETKRTGGKILVEQDGHYKEIVGFGK